MGDHLLCPQCKAVGIWSEIFWSGRKGYQFCCSDCGLAGPISGAKPTLGTNGLPASRECWDCGWPMAAVVRKNGPICEPWWACCCGRLMAVTPDQLATSWAPLVAAGLVDFHAWPWETTNETAEEESNG